MSLLTFDYYLLHRTDGSIAEPVNLIALARQGGPVQAVIWDRPTDRWNFRPDVAAGILYSDQDVSRTVLVDRATAQALTHHFTAIPLPSEEELTRICQAASRR